MYSDITSRSGVEEHVDRLLIIFTVDRILIISPPHPHQMLIIFPPSHSDSEQSWPSLIAWKRPFYSFCFSLIYLWVPSADWKNKTRYNKVFIVFDQNRIYPIQLSTTSLSNLDKFPVIAQNMLSTISWLIHRDPFLHFLKDRFLFLSESIPCALRTQSKILFYENTFKKKKWFFTGFLNTNIGEHSIR